MDNGKLIMENGELVPDLRFPEFEGGWKSNKFGDIASFSKGKGLSKSDIDESGDLECIRYGELYTHYNEVIDSVISRTNAPKTKLILSEADDVIIPASGETQIDIATASCVRKSGVALSGDLNIIKSKLNGVFLAYYLNNKKKLDIARLSQGISVVHLYSSQLKSLTLNFPDDEEQQKIANFLTAIDQRITLLKEKKAALEDYKKGLMQKIFSQEIRFKDGEGNDFPDWEDVRLGDVGNTLNGLTGKTKVNFGRGKHYVQYTQIFSNSKINIKECGLVEISSDEKQTRLKKGDVLFTTSSETPNEIGTSSVIVDDIDEVYLNSFCFGYRQAENTFSPEFSQFFFRSETVRKEIIKLAQGSTRFNMSKKEFIKLKFKAPSLKEQKKIADCLSAIDQSINQLTKQIDQTTQFKKGLLQRMFV